VVLQSNELSNHEATMDPFLANVNSRSRSLYAIARPSVCRMSVCRLPVVCLSSVTFVRPTQAVEIFLNICTALGTLAIRWHPTKIFAEIVPGEPLRRGSWTQEG